MSNDTPGQYDHRVIPGACEFFGAMTASVSHELNNVLSIIDQNIGLVDDMVRAEEQGRPLSVERLAQAVSAIHKQDQRGLKIIRRLNRFAHSADAAVMEFDVNETIGNFVELVTRLVNLKQMSLTYTPYAEPLMIRNRPFALQQLLFAVMRPVLASAVPERALDVSVATGDDGFVVTLTAPFPVSQDVASEETLELVEALAGRIDVETADAGTTIRLHGALKLPPEGVRS
jgi:C4-dicarboxylate-specific signal transduction histidine kinase